VAIPVTVKNLGREKRRWSCARASPAETARRAVIERPFPYNASVVSLRVVDLPVPRRSRKGQRGDRVISHSLRLQNSCLNLSARVGSLLATLLQQERRTIPHARFTFYPIIIFPNSRCKLVATKNANIPNRKATFISVANRFQLEHAHYTASPFACQRTHSGGAGFHVELRFCGASGGGAA